MLQLCTLAKRKFIRDYSISKSTTFLQISFTDVNKSNLIRVDRLVLMKLDLIRLFHFNILVVF
jgi:hypothetical protein